MRRRAMRIAVVAAVCIAAGMVVTVATAWGCSLWADAAQASPVHLAQLWSRDSGMDAVGPVPPDIIDLIPEPWRSPPSPRVSEMVTASYRSSGLGIQVLTVEVDEGLPPGVMKFSRLVDREIQRCRAGWPMPALTSTGYLDRLAPGRAAAPRMQWDGGVAAPSWLIGSSTPHAGQLPWRPVPLGFAVNTLCYAVLVMLLAAAPIRLRRRSRRRRGLCIRCGYSRAGLASDTACPECGVV